MNIYSVIRTDGNMGYDEYIGFVICANNKKEAKTLMKSADEKDYAKWRITKIGTTHYKTPRAILDSLISG